MPGLRQHHLMTALKRLADRPDLLGLMFKNGEGHIEPFPFLCRSEAVDVVAGHLESGRLAVHSLLDADGFAVEFAPSDWTPDVWTNLNDPTDFKRFLARQEPLNDWGDEWPRSQNVTSPDSRPSRTRDADRVASHFPRT